MATFEVTEVKRDRDGFVSITSVISLDPAHEAEEFEQIITDPTGFIEDCAWDTGITERVLEVL